MIVDIAVIIVLGVVIVLLSEFGSENAVTIFAIPLCMACYFFGKWRVKNEGDKVA